MVSWRWLLLAFLDLRLLPKRSSSQERSRLSGVDGPLERRSFPLWPVLRRPWSLPGRAAGCGAVEPRPGAGRDVPPVGPPRLGAEPGREAP